MTDRPLVSILIPTYNRPSYLREAVASALAQTYPAVEVVVMDDASQQATRDVVRQFVDDERVVYHRQPANVGPNRNWSAAIEAARGAYFCILADDDRLHPEFVERLVEPLEADSGLALAFSDHWVIDEAGVRDPDVTGHAAAKYGRRRLRAGRLDQFGRTALIDESIYISAALFRRRALGPDPLPEEAESSIGGWLFYVCVSGGGGGYYVPSRLVECRWVAGSVSRSRRWWPAVARGSINRYRKILSDPALTQLHGAAEERLVHGLAHYARTRLVEGHRTEARRAAREVFDYRFSWLAGGTMLLGYLGRVGTITGRGLARADAFVRRLLTRDASLLASM